MMSFYENEFLRNSITNGPLQMMVVMFGKPELKIVNTKEGERDFVRLIT